MLTAMTDLSDLTHGELRCCVRHLNWKCDRFHRAAHWLLGIAVTEAVVIAWLLWS